MTCTRPLRGASASLSEVSIASDRTSGASSSVIAFRMASRSSVSSSSVRSAASLSAMVSCSCSTGSSASTVSSAVAAMGVCSASSRLASTGSCAATGASSVASSSVSAKSASSSSACAGRRTIVSTKSSSGAVSSCVALPALSATASCAASTRSSGSANELVSTGATGVASSVTSWSIGSSSPASVIASCSAVAVDRAFTTLRIFCRRSSNVSLASASSCVVSDVSKRLSIVDVSVCASRVIGPTGVCGSCAGVRTTLVPSVRAAMPSCLLRLASTVNISASSFGGSAPKKRSCSARSRKYSATSFIMPKESSNPSSVQENVPYDTVSTLFELLFTILKHLFLN